jgi:hypothetical protein
MLALRRNTLLAAIMSLAVAVRLVNVWRAGLSQDEVASARILREPTFAGALHRVVRTESTPPLWYSLGWLVHRAYVPIVDVRLLSVAYGAALAGLTFVLASRVLGPIPAATSGFFAALAYEPVAHGAELRAYEQLALLAAALAYVLLREPSRSTDIALAITVWAGLLTHYFFVFSLLTAVAWLWLDRRAAERRRRSTYAIAFGAVAAAPWLPGFLTQYRHDRFWWIGRFSLRVVAVTPLRVFAPLGVRHMAVASAVLAVVAVGAWSLARRSSAGTLLAALAILPIVFAAAAWAGDMRIYAVRNLIETAPFVAIAAAAALARIRQRAVLPAVAAAVAAVAGISVATLAPRPTPFETIAHALVADGWRPRDPIAVYGNFFVFRAPLEWHLPRGPLLDVAEPTRRACPAVFVVKGSGDGTFDVDRLAHRAPHVRRATLLATPGAICVHASRNPRLLPLS